MLKSHISMVPVPAPQGSGIDDHPILRLKSADARATVRTTDSAADARLNCCCYEMLRIQAEEMNSDRGLRVDVRNGEYRKDAGLTGIPPEQKPHNRRYQRPQILGTHTPKDHPREPRQLNSDGQFQLNISQNNRKGESNEMITPTHAMSDGQRHKAENLR